jgi:hypothetical protein
MERETIKFNNGELNRVNEMMLQNIQSSNEHNMNSVQYIIAETILQINLRRNSRRNIDKSQGELYESSPLRSDGSLDS